MRESASTDLREPQGSNPLGPPGPELVSTLNYLIPTDYVLAFENERDYKCDRE